MEGDRSPHLMLALVMLYESSPVASAATRVQDCLPQVTASISPAAFTNTNTHIPYQWREVIKKSTFLAT